MLFKAILAIFALGFAASARRIVERKGDAKKRRKLLVDVGYKRSVDTPSSAALDIPGSRSLCWLQRYCSGF